MNRSRIWNSGTALMSMGMFDNIPGLGRTKWAGQDVTPQASGGGGSAAPKQNDNRQAGGQNNDDNSARRQDDNQNNNDDNNGDPNDQMINDIWKEEQANTRKQKQQDEQDADDNRGGGQTPNAEEQLQSYLKKVGLDDFELSDDEVEQLRTGDANAVMRKVNQRIQRAHLAGLESFNRLVSDRIPKMVEEAVKKSTKIFVDDKARDTMNKELPWTKNKLMAPVAESVMKRFMDQGADIPQAVAATKKYFQRMAQTIGENEINSNTRDGGRGRTPQNPGETNWQSMLRGEDE